jgi:hypothetical protein
MAMHLFTKDRQKRFIYEHRNEYRLEKLCRVMKISRIELKQRNREWKIIAITFFGKINAN